MNRALFKQSIFIIFVFLFSDHLSTLLKHEIPGTNTPLILWITRSVSLLILLISIFIHYINRHQLHSLLSQNRGQAVIITSLTALIVSSAIWSIDTLTTVKQTLHFLNATLLGIHIASNFNVRERINLFSVIFGMIIIMSFLLIALLPSQGVMGVGESLTLQEIAHAGTWRGVYSHKNQLGIYIVVSTVVFYFFSKINSRQYRWLAFLGMGLSLCLVIGSTSRTALLSLTSLTALGFTLEVLLPAFLRLQRAQKILYSGVLVSLVLFITSQARSFLSLVGRDITFSNRTVIGDIVWMKIQERPLTGFGYKAFWIKSCGEGPSCNSLILDWNPVTSHNGFLEIGLGIGLIGLILFSVSYILFIGNSLRAFIKTHNQELLFIIVFLSFLVLANLFESLLLSYGLFWSIYLSLIDFKSQSLKAKSEL